MIKITDQKTTYHIPVLIRISNSSVNINENNGRLDFGIQSLGEWSYAKISVFDIDFRLVDSTSITPTNANEPILIHDVGTYWIQAELKSGKGTINLYDTVVVKTPAKSGFSIRDVGLPTQPFLIIIVIIGAVIISGLIIRKFMVLVPRL
jgi:minor extracellular serine protease Vpr